MTQPKIVAVDRESVPLIADDTVDLQLIAGLLDLVDRYGWTGVASTLVRMQTNGDQVIVSRERLLQLFGKWGLPPWPDRDGNPTLGGDVDCAPLAEQIVADVDILCGTTPPATNETAVAPDADQGRRDPDRPGWITDPTDPEFLPDLVEAAWGLIANAGWNLGHPGQGPGEPSPGWDDAAVAWRERYHRWLDMAYPQTPADPTEPDVAIAAAYWRICQPDQPWVDPDTWPGGDHGHTDCWVIGTLLTRLGATPPPPDPSGNDL